MIRRDFSSTFALQTSEIIPKEMKWLVLIIQCLTNRTETSMGISTVIICSLFYRAYCNEFMQIKQGALIIWGVIIQIPAWIGAFPRKHSFKTLKYFLINNHFMTWTPTLNSVLVHHQHLYFQRRPLQGKVANIPHKYRIIWG